MRWGIYCCTSIYGTCSAGYLTAGKEVISFVCGKTASPALSEAQFLFNKTESEAVNDRITYCKRDGFWLTPSEMHGCKISVLVQVVSQKKTAPGQRCVCVCVWSWWIILSSRVVVRCVHQSRFLANDAWGWKWPGRSPGSTYTECCWVDTLAVRWAPTIRWLPLRFCEERETCYVLNVSPAGGDDKVFDPP